MRSLKAMARRHVPNTAGEDAKKYEYAVEHFAKIVHILQLLSWIAAELPAVPTPLPDAAFYTKARDAGLDWPTLCGVTDRKLVAAAARTTKEKFWADVPEDQYWAVYVQSVLLVAAKRTRPHDSADTTPTTPSSSAKRGRRRRRRQRAHRATPPSKALHLAALSVQHRAVGPLSIYLAGAVGEAGDADVAGQFRNFVLKSQLMGLGGKSNQGTLAQYTEAPDVFAVTTVDVENAAKSPYVALAAMQHLRVFMGPPHQLWPEFRRILDDVLDAVSEQHGPDVAGVVRNAATRAGAQNEEAVEREHANTTAPVPVPGADTAAAAGVPPVVLPAEVAAALSRATRVLDRYRHFVDPEELFSSVV